MGSAETGWLRCACCCLLLRLSPFFEEDRCRLRKPDFFMLLAELSALLFCFDSWRRDALEAIELESEE